MKRVSIATALLSGLAIGLVTQARYAPIAREVPRLLAASDPASEAGALASQAWVGPSLLIPGLALLMGIVAAWLAAREDTGQRWAGARVGLAGGLGALVAVTIVFTMMFAALGADPVVQAFVRMSEPHPEARLATDVIPWLGAGGGALFGLAVGAESFAAMMFGGAAVDVLRERSMPTATRPVR